MKKFLQIILASVLFIGMLLSPMSNVAQAAENQDSKNIPENKEVFIVSRLASRTKILDVNNDASYNNVTIWDKNGGDNQRWIIESTSQGNPYRIRNKATNGLLTMDGNNVCVKPNNYTTEQLWWIEPNSDGYYIIRNHTNYDMALDVNRRHTYNGNNVQVYRRNFEINQQWKFEIL